MTTTVLDAVETKRRLLQNGLIVAGVGLLILSLVAFNTAASPKTSVAGWALLVLGFAALPAALRIKVRWHVDYKGHAIVFENDPIRGEHLWIDGILAGKGRLGARNTITGRLPSGERVLATSVAGATRFSCRIDVESAPAGAADVSAAVSRASAPFE